MNTGFIGSVNLLKPEVDKCIKKGTLTFSTENNM